MKSHAVSIGAALAVMAAIAVASASFTAAARGNDRNVAHFLRLMAFAHGLVKKTP